MPGSSITLRSRGGRNDSFRKRKSQRGEGQELEQEAQGSDCPVSLGRHESEVCVVRIPLKTLVAAEGGSTERHTCPVAAHQGGTGKTFSDHPGTGRVLPPHQESTWALLSHNEPAAC